MPTPTIKPGGPGSEHYVLVDADGDALGCVLPIRPYARFASIEEARAFAASHTRHPVRYPEPWRLVTERDYLAVTRAIAAAGPELVARAQAALEAHAALGGRS